MELSLESIIFYLLLIDALGANLLAWSGQQTWWQRAYSPIARHLPLARGWTTYYLLLVIIMGILLFRLDALVLPL
ncbi:hypothetical protein N9L26_01600 [Candidatus Pacebacteria bacterium]|nr:hypothetical protein [Candidatus Paceibacterota bacterium]